MPSLPLSSISVIALFLAPLIQVGSLVLSLLLFFGPANVIPLLFYPSLLTALLVVYLLSASLPTLLLHLLPLPFSTLVFSPKLITVGVKLMAPIYGSPGTGPPLYLAIGLNKFLVTTFSSVFPLI
jgi:hypothetical protein